MVIQSIELDGLKKSEASELFNISRNTINLWLQRKAETGDVLPLPNHPPGNNHKITDWDQFRAFAKSHGDKTQVEMAQLWEGNKARSHNRKSVKENWVHAKKKTYGYQERDEIKRQAFIEQLTTQADETIVYVDEAGMDNREDYGYGWNEKGERFHALKSGRRRGRVNMIAALRNHQLMAPFTIEGSCNRIVFEIWLETCLIPLLEPGQVVVIDNAMISEVARIVLPAGIFSISVVIYSIIFC